MQEIDFYEGLSLIRKSEVPFDITFTKLSFAKNEGGERRTLEHQLLGPNKKNVNDEMMIGLKSADNPDELSHIYIHTILEVCFVDGRAFKLILN